MSMNLIEARANGLSSWYKVAFIPWVLLSEKTRA